MPNRLRRRRRSPRQGTIGNRLEGIRKLVKKPKERGEIRACYEAGPTGYCLYWQLTQLGVDCEVIAPSLIPNKASERIQADRRTVSVGGELTAVAVSGAEQDALRHLVRAREAAEKDQLKARHRLSKFLLRHDQKPEGIQPWTKQFLEWIRTNVRFPHKALEVTLLNYLHEVEHVAQGSLYWEAAIDEAATIVSELGSLARVASPRQ